MVRKVKLATAKQMRNVDREAEDIYGIPGILLMENAGMKVASHVMEIDSNFSKNICIICGKGNNGGDGFTAAKHIYLKNRNITVFLLGSMESLKGDALVNYNIAYKMGIPIKPVNCEEDMAQLRDAVKKSDIVVDALLGTGIKGEVSGLCREVIDIINKYSSYVISVDIPSGVDADSGKILGAGVKADMTVTFVLPKIGLYAYPGANMAGRVFVEDISTPPDLIENLDTDTWVLSRSDVEGSFPVRDKNSNKGTYGRVYIVAGSMGMMGAAAMCTLSALRCGTGLVELGVPSCIQNQVAPLAVEAMVTPLCDKDGMISILAQDEIIKSIKRASSFAIGPGISQSEDLLTILGRVMSESNVPGVIDADGLNLLSQNIDMLHGHKCPLILTPHPGEMARLIKKDISYVQNNRIECAREFSSKYNVVTVLKGAGTVIASCNGDVFLNPTGNPGMAKGGSGDVLTGMAASLLAQGIDPFEAAKSAVYIHGLAGDLTDRDRGEYGMKAGDMIENIPNAIKAVSGI